MSFFYATDEDELQYNGATYRILGTKCPWWDGRPDLIESATAIAAATAAPDTFPNGMSVIPDENCGAEWRTYTAPGARMRLYKAVTKYYDNLIEDTVRALENPRGVKPAQVAREVARIVLNR